MKRIIGAAAFVLASGGLAQAEPTKPVYNISVEVREGNETTGQFSFNALQGQTAAVESSGPGGFRVEALVEQAGGAEVLSMSIWMMRNGELHEVAKPRISLIEGRTASFSTSSPDFGLSVEAGPG